MRLVFVIIRNVIKHNDAFQRRHFLGVFQQFLHFGLFITENYFHCSCKEDTKNLPKLICNYIIELNFGRNNPLTLVNDKSACIRAQGVVKGNHNHGKHVACLFRYKPLHSKKTNGRTSLVQSALSIVSANQHAPEGNYWRKSQPDSDRWASDRDARDRIQPVERAQAHRRNAATPTSRWVRCDCRSRARCLVKRCA